MGNVWAWFHILAAGTGAKIFLQYNDDKWQVLLAVFLITIGWEIYEFITDGGVAGMIKIYGSLERWFYDSLGDVVGANFMAYVVVI